MDEYVFWDHRGEEKQLSEIVERTERIKNLDYMRGMGAVLVIIGHATPRSIVGCFIYSFHMPLFFFISGYLYKHRDAKRMIASKVRYLLVPYFFSRLIVVPLTQGLSIMNYEYIFDVLFRGSDWWFTYVLFFTVMSFWTIDDISMRIASKLHIELLGYWPLLVGTICIAIRMLGILNIGIFAFNRVTYMMFYFIGGHCLKNYVLKRSDVWREISGQNLELHPGGGRNNILLTVEICLLVFLNCLYPYKEWFYYARTDISQYLAAFCGIGLIFNLSSRIKQREGIGIILSYMGEYSLQYYLFPNITIGCFESRGLLYAVWTFVCHTIYIYIAKKSKFLSCVYGIRSKK